MIELFWIVVVLVLVAGAFNTVNPYSSRTQERDRRKAQAKAAAERAAREQS